LVRMTPPMSQNIVVMSAKNAILLTWRSGVETIRPGLFT
jgi:hypothetical protein